MTDSSITFETRDKVRTWGGWYRHTVVKVAGIERGRIQERVRPGSKGRREYLTIRADAFGGGCVLGSHVEWLTRS